MKKILWLGICCILMFSMVGCSKSGKNGGKTFTFASELDINTMDSTVSDDGMSFNAMHAVIDGLMGLDKDGKIVPAIAKSYKLSDDKLVYTYTLRDTKWSNGDKVTADDFVYAWQRIIKNAGNYAYMFGSDGAAIAGADALMEKQASGKDLTQKDMDTLGVKAIDDHTLEVKVERPCSYFDELMTFPCYYPINRKFAEEKGDSYAKKADTVLSNGAFKLKSWELGTKAVFEKNPDYWNKDAVKIDKLVMLLVQDPKTAAANFDAKNNDFAVINSSLVDKYKNKPEYQTYSEGYLFYLQLNMNKDTMANANVRKALSLAINRKDFAENVLKDGSKEAKGFVPSGLCINDGTDFRKKAKDFTSFDLAKAQEALDAGLKELGKDSITIQLLYGTDESPMDQMATYLQNAFSKLKGLKIEMVATTKKDRIYNKQKNREFEVALTRWGPDYGDATTYLNLMLKGNANNYGDYNSEAYMSKMDEVKKTEDAGERFNKMIEAEEIAMNDGANIPVFEKGSSVLIRTNVKNLVHRPVGVPYTFNYVEMK
ncbi:oligopeptide ABC transporter, periplasmic oligopeptide-binding protein OppA [Lachnospiraceae bacterium KM106-2]|nr:oligopeptide ABC transporter, periplasmic oligopeptide-binding protein OppA [Lachnospiraceae bacterium KM106-2]